MHHILHIASRLCLVSRRSLGLPKTIRWWTGVLSCIKRAALRTRAPSRTALLEPSNGASLQWWSVSGDCRTGSPLWRVDPLVFHGQTRRRRGYVWILVVALCIGLLLGLSLICRRWLSGCNGELSTRKGAETWTPSRWCISTALFLIGVVVVHHLGRRGCGESRLGLM
jgi:hypothetical protein